MIRDRFNSLSISDLTRFATVLVIAALMLPACRGDRPARDESWQINGSLLAWDAGVWIVDAIPIVVPAEIVHDSSPILGARVSATGHINDSGQRVAESIDLSVGPLPESTLPSVSLTGTVERIDDDRWIINGQEVVVPGGTQIRAEDPASDVASLVRTDSLADISGYRMRDGSVIATDILLRTQNTVQPPPQATNNQAQQPEPTTPTKSEQPPADDVDTEQPSPATTTTDDAESDTDDGGDQQDATDDQQDVQDDDQNKDHGKPDKPDKPEKPDKPDNGNGHDKDKKEQH